MKLKFRSRVIWVRRLPHLDLWLDRLPGQVAAHLGRYAVVVWRER